MNQRTTACSRCKPNCPCLSHSFLPFGQCWLELDSPLLKAYPQRRIHDTSGSCKRDDSGRYFFDLKGLSFDETPLGYLDWLAGQPWLRPGIFRDRLFKYLSHPCIQKELENMFPDPDDDSRKPVFIAHLQHDRWHGQQRHREEPAPQSEDFSFTMTTAWQAIADFMAEADNAMSSDTYDVATALETFYWLKAAIAWLRRGWHLITAEQLTAIRSKYRAYRQALRRAKMQPVEGKYYSAEDRLFDLIQNAHYVT